MSDFGYEVDFLPIGEKSKGGDAILVRFGNLKLAKPEQKIVVIDGGYKSDGNKIIDFVQNVYKSNVIDLVILTHPDKDHVSGLITLFECEDIIIKQLVMHRPWNNDKINVDYFVDRRITDNSLNQRLKRAFSLAYQLEQLANKSNIQITEPRLGSTFLDGVIKILGPNAQLYRESLISSSKTPIQIEGYTNTIKSFSSSSDYEYEFVDINTEIEWLDDEQTSSINQTSVVTLFSFDNNDKILLTGDTGKEGLQNVYNYVNDRNIDLTNLKIFQIPHHGSRKNISPTLLDCFNSSFYFISCPPEGDPKHPSRRLISVMYQKRLNVYKTGGLNLNYECNAPSRIGYSSASSLFFNQQIEK